MAMKDWKPTTPQNPDMGEIAQWDNKARNGRVWVQQTKPDSFWVNAYIDGYASGVFNKNYKSRASAFASAKRFMRLN